MRKDFITPFVTALDWCQLNIRVFILEATAEVVGHNIDEFPISTRSSKKKIIVEIKEHAEDIKLGSKLIICSLE